MTLFFLSSDPARRTRRAATLAVSLLGASMALVVGCRGNPSPGPETTPATPLALQILVQRGAGPSERVAPGGRVATGETMQFELTHAQGGYVAVLGLTSDPSVHIFTPRLKPAIHLPGPGKTLLPEPITAEDTTGRQRVIALVCPNEVPALTLQLAGRRAVVTHPHLDDITALALPCAQASVSIERGPPILRSEDPTAKR